MRFWIFFSLLMWWTFSFTAFPSHGMSILESYDFKSFCVLQLLLSESKQLFVKWSECLSYVHMFSCNLLFSLNGYRDTTVIGILLPLVIHCCFTFSFAACTAALHLLHTSLGDFLVINLVHMLHFFILVGSVILMQTTWCALTQRWTENYLNILSSLRQCTQSQLYVMASYFVEPSAKILSLFVTGTKHLYSLLAKKVFFWLCIRKLHTYKI